LLLCVHTGGSTDTTVTLFDIGIPQGDNYKTDIRLTVAYLFDDIVLRVLRDTGT